MRELLDCTGRQLHPNKRGAIPATAPPLLERLDIELKKWMTLTQPFDTARLSGHAFSVPDGGVQPVLLLRARRECQSDAVRLSLTLVVDDGCIHQWADQ